MNVLSLFDGMSCGQIALERAGIKVSNYYASEIDGYTIRVTQANYPNTIQLGSVQDVQGADLPKIDLLLGGSPCQGLSQCGHRLGFEDERSKLFFEFTRLLKECRPKHFLFENVRMTEEYRGIITEQLGVEPVKIDSSLVSAQNRVRYYWTNIPNIKQPKDKRITLQDVCNEKHDVVGIINTPRGNNKGGLRNDGSKSPTLSKSSWQHNNHILLKDGSLKKLTPTECERLQTVPDGHTDHVSNTQRYKMLGNGWTVDVIAHILSTINQ